MSLYTFFNERLVLIIMTTFIFLKFIQKNVEFVYNICIINYEGQF